MITIEHGKQYRYGCVVHGTKNIAKAFYMCGARPPFYPVPAIIYAVVYTENEIIFINKSGGM